MADTSTLPTANEPQGTNWLEEVKRDAEYLYKKRLDEQKRDKEYEASKAAAKQATKK